MNTGTKIALGVAAAFTLSLVFGVALCRAAAAGDRRLAPHDTPPPVEPKPLPAPVLAALMPLHNPAVRWDQEIVEAAFQAVMGRHWPAAPEPTR